MLVTQSQYEYIKGKAQGAYPDEAVFLVTAVGVHHVDNIADDPRTEFLVKDADMLAAVKEGLRGVIHSHPDGPPWPSEADMDAQIACAVPFGILTSAADSAGDYFEFGGAPESLTLRPFRHGVTDCYGFIRDYYATHYGVRLPDFARAWEWWSGEAPADMYLDNTKAVGFVEVPREEVRAGDMIVFTLRGVACHAAIYTGNGVIAHHPCHRKAYDATRIPVVEPVHRWTPHISHIFRHPGVNHVDD